MPFKPWILLACGLLLTIFSGGLLLDAIIALLKRLGKHGAHIATKLSLLRSVLPVTAIALAASVNGQTGLATGTIYGFTTASFCVILGITIFASAPIIKDREALLNKTCRLLLIATGVFALTAINGAITRVTGIIMLIYTAVHLYQKKEPCKHTNVKDITIIPPVYCVLILLISVFGVVTGVHFFTNNAAHTARELGISESLIGMTFIASTVLLPIAVMSIRRAQSSGAYEIVEGIIETDTYGMLLALGLSAVMRDLQFTVEYAVIHMPFLILAVLLIFIAALICRKIPRILGGCLMILYCVYMGITVALKL